MNKFKALPKSIALSFFLIGLISAVSFRAIIIAQKVNPSYVRILWYTAVISNFIFFLYRYYISRKRKLAIGSTTLIEKLNQGKPLNDSEKKAVIYLLTSIERSRENLNYMSIFILSALAILIDIILTLHSN